MRWSFEVRPSDDVDPRYGGIWVYTGDPVEIVPREPEPEPIEPPSWFICPHCGVRNYQDPGNFHYWCGRCGRNAHE